MIVTLIVGFVAAVSTLIYAAIRHYRDQHTGWGTVHDEVIEIDDDE